MLAQKLEQTGAIPIQLSHLKAGVPMSHRKWCLAFALHQSEARSKCLLVPWCCDLSKCLPVRWCCGELSKCLLVRWCCAALSKCLLVPWCCDLSKCLLVRWCCGDLSIYLLVPWCCAALARDLQITSIVNTLLLGLPDTVWLTMRGPAGCGLGSVELTRGNQRIQNCMSN